MKVFFQGASVLFELNLCLPSKISIYNDIDITLCTAYPMPYLYGKLFSRYYNNIEVKMIMPPLFTLSSQIRTISYSIASFAAKHNLYQNMTANFDIFHFNHPEHPLTGASTYLRKPKILTFNWITPWLSHEHGNDFIYQMDAITSCSQFVSDWLQKEMHVKSSVIYHGVDTSLFNTSIPKSEARKHLGLKETTTILWNSRMVPGKDLNTLIEAIPIVVKEIPDILFLVKGRTYRSKDSQLTLRQAKRKIRENNIIKNVKFDLKYDFISKMPYYYRSSDLFVHTSYLESFGLVFAEAMSCGIPVVAAKGSAAPEVLGNAGSLFEPKNPYDLAENILKILNDENLRQTMCKKGLDRISEIGLTWKHAAKSYRDLYLSILL